MNKQKNDRTLKGFLALARNSFLLYREDIKEMTVDANIKFLEL